MDISNLITLAMAKAKPADEFVIDGLADEIKAALAEVVADEKKTAAKAAALEIVALFGKARAKETAIVEEIRALRRKEAELKSVLAKINAARVYSQENSNFLPLTVAIGIEVPFRYRAQFPDLFVIPVAKAVQE